MPKITPQLIAALKPRSCEYAIADSVEPALSIRVRPSGFMSWQCRYRANSGAVRRFTIGPVARLTVAQARKKAADIRAHAHLGSDPAGDKAAARKAMTVAELCAFYLRDGVAHKRTSTLEIDKGRIERHIKPLLGLAKVADLTAGDVRKFLKDVAGGATAADIKTKPRGRARVTGGPGTANRTLGLLSGIMAFAIDHGIRKDNPVHGIKRFAGGKRERFLSGAELARLGDQLRGLESAGANPKAIAIIRLLALTGCRKNEIASLQWSAVDMEHSCLRLSRSKTGAKIVPIGPPALAVLASVNPVAGSRYVFPSETGEGHFRGVEKIWHKARLLSGLGKVRIHDLRHSFASAGLMAGSSLPLIGKLLGHADLSTTAQYAHLADDPVKIAAARISGSIAAAMGAAPPADVVKLKG